MSTKKKGWDCQDDECTRTVQDGPLWRVNPKGAPGVFLCREHAEGYLLAEAEGAESEVPDAR